MLLKKKCASLFVGLMILLVAVPLISSGSYGSGAYSAGDYNVGAVSAPDSGGSSDEGGSSWQCSEDEDCGEERYCLKYVCYDYSCYSDADCNLSVGETCWMHQCVKLFDVKIIDFQSPIQLGTEFEFTYFLKGMADISGDVEVHFWIEKDGEAVTSGHDTIYIGNFEEKTEKTKIYLPTTIDSGVYTFFVQLVYGDYIANTHRTVEIAVDESGVASIVGVAETAAKGFELYAIPVLIGFALFMLFIIFWMERKKIIAGINREERWVKKHKVTVSVSILFTLLGVLAYCLDRIGYISFQGVGRSFVDILSPFSSYFYYALGSIVSLIFLIVAVVLCKKNRVIQRIKSLLSERRKSESDVKVAKPKVVTKPVVRNVSFVSEHKKFLGVLFVAAFLMGLVGFLFYSGIFTIAFLQGLWNSVVGWFRSVVGWIVPFARTIPFYLSPQNEYFYPVMAGVVGFVVLLVLGIIVKRASLFEKFKEWREQKRVEDEKVENIKVRVEKFENFKEVVGKHKVSLIILGILVLSCGVVGALFYSGIVTVGQISEGMGNVADSIRSGWGSMVNVVRDFVLNVGEFVRDYCIPILSCIGGVVLILAAYLNRNNLQQTFYKTKDFVVRHKLFFLILLGLTILSGIVFYLFYSGIVTVEQISKGIGDILNSVKSGLQNFVQITGDFVLKVGSYIKSYYIPILSCIGGGVLILTAYLKRGSLTEFFGGLSYRLSGLSNKQKIITLVILVMMLLAGLIYALFGYGILSVEQFSSFFSNFGERMSEFGKNLVGGSLNLWDDVSSFLSGTFTSFLGWVVRSYIYLIAGVFVAIMAVVSYLGRENLQQGFFMIKDFVDRHKLFFLIFLGLIVVLSGIAFYLFYSKIVTVEKLKGIFDFIGNFQF